MAFRVWTYFLAFIAIMMILLWMFQITFLEPYYKSSRTKNIVFSISEVQRLMQDPSDEEVKTKLRLLFARENMCGIVYDENGVNIMNIAVDVIGPNCYLDDMSLASKDEYIETLKNSESKEIDVPFRNEFFDHAMSFYGKEIMIDESP